MLDIDAPYRDEWDPVLVGLHPTWKRDTTGVLPLSTGTLYRTSVRGSPPSTPGFYEDMTIQLNYSRVRTPAILNGEQRIVCPTVVVTRTLVSIDVTCSATILNNWCDGERRWIPKTKRCVKTYKPCGQELAAGVANTDLCTQYACFNNNRTCGRVPLGSGCSDCTVVGSCAPNCTNAADNSPRLCGDDGCGSLCGPNTVGNGCDPNNLNGKTSCDGLFGQCVVPQNGACVRPYPLFGNSLPPGDPALNPADAAGIHYYVLNNMSPITTEPSFEVTPASRPTIEAGYQWPSDGFTVPATGVRLAITFDSTYYPDSISTRDNAIGTPDVNFKFCIPAGQVQAVDAYISDGAENCSPTGGDTYLALVPDNCGPFATTDPSFHPADVFDSDDATPPGSYCSHVVAVGLEGGATGRCYILVGTTYSLQNAGPLRMNVVFTRRTSGPCVAICQGHMCGTNECDGMCNIVPCSGGLTCNNGLCTDCPNIPRNPPNCLRLGDVNFPAPYNNDTVLYQKECGEDSSNCGQSCGTCPTGTTCQLQMGICMPTPVCDFNVPVCSGPYPSGGLHPYRSEKQKRYGLSQVGLKPQYYCNSFCEWAELNDPLPDIIPNDEQMVMPSVLIHWRRFDKLSCTYEENCVFGNGSRLIYRLNTDIMNIGTGEFIGVDQFTRPDIVVYAKCHQHPHMKGFAGNELFYFGNASRAINSSKQSYCVEATYGFFIYIVYHLEN